MATPRIETRDDGRERIRYWDGERERYVYVYRLAAVAWGIIDGLADDRHVHHDEPIPWYVAESNLEAVEPEPHGEITARQRAARRPA